MRHINSYSANQVVRRLGRDAVVWIDPASVARNVNSLRTRKPKAAGRLLERLALANANTRGWSNPFYRNRFVIDGEDFSNGEKFEDLETFRLLDNFLRHRDRIGDSLLFGRLKSELDLRGSASYRKFRFESEAEIVAFLTGYLASLCESLQRNGVELSRSPDIPKCYVSAEGQLLKGENGRHRLALAKLLGLERFPLQVYGVHENWYRDHVGKMADFSKLGKEIRKLEARHCKRV